MLRCSFHPFLHRLIKHTKQLLEENEERLCIKVLQTLREMMTKDRGYGEKVTGEEKIWIINIQLMEGQRTSRFTRTDIFKYYQLSTCQSCVLQSDWKVSQPAALSEKYYGVTSLYKLSFLALCACKLMLLTSVYCFLIAPSYAFIVCICHLHVYCTCLLSLFNLVSLIITCFI